MKTKATVGGYSTVRCRVFSIRASDSVPHGGKNLLRDLFAQAVFFFHCGLMLQM